METNLLEKIRRRSAEERTALDTNCQERRTPDQDTIADHTNNEEKKRLMEMKSRKYSDQGYH
jgi:hypothetical protein